MRQFWQTTLLACFLVLSSMVSTAYAQVREKNIHRVSRGETLYGIARKYDMSLTELRKLNPQVKGNNIFPNQDLVVTIETDEEDIEYLAGGLPRRMMSREDSDKPENWEDGHMDNLNKRQAYRVFEFNKDEASPEKVELMNKLNFKRYTYHTVKQGETIYSIAKKYGVKPNDIKAFNRDRSIKAGTRLYIPLSRGSVSVSVPSEKADRKAPDGFFVKRHSDLQNQEEMNRENGAYRVVAFDKQTNPFYVVHPNLPNGQTVYIQIPSNAGYLEAKVIGQLSVNSNYSIGISPRIYEIIKISNRSSKLTYFYE
ncbi:MAG: LysM domain-containing protein [Bacteroidota bacterium]